MTLMGKLKGEVPEEEIRRRGEAGEYFDWNYECPDYMNKSTGYEDVDFSKYTSEWLRSQSNDPKEQDKILEEVADIFLEKDIFPIWYFSEMGALDEVQRTLETETKFKGDYVKGNSAGRAYMYWRFPNVHKVMIPQQGKARGSMYEKFHIKSELCQALRFMLANGKGHSEVNVTRLYSSMRLVGSSSGGFKATDASAIYDRYTPEGGLILDTSMGFGGRMLGAMTAKKHLRYVGTDPNTETFYHLLQQRDDLEALGIDVDERIEMHCCGSEAISGLEGQCDFMFTSPPYFDLEVYTDEETQSYNMFPDLDSWFEGYVRPTIRAIRESLKVGGYAAIKIADFTVRKDKPEGGYYSEPVNYVDRWVEMSNQEGLLLDSEFYSGVSARAGSSARTNGSGVKKERVPVFRKV